ncbi:MAG: hypothetical protein EOM54_11980 [Clostridia bacterium]|nr:hypothetical protein [Clostridia bacterium]
MVFYGLDRFSEDLDFSLKAPDANFDLAAYLPTLEKEVRSYGLNFKIEAKDKSVDSAVKSEFLKGNTKEHIMMFYADERLAPSIAASKLIKVKFEVDTNPPAFATFERKYRLQPIPYEITELEPEKIKKLNTFEGSQMEKLLEKNQRLKQWVDEVDVVPLSSQATSLYGQRHLSGTWRP